MRDLSARFKAIQAAAGGHPTEQISMDTMIGSTPTVVPEPVERKGFDWPSDVATPVWPRADILAALEKGASSYALTLCLQAIADLAGDPSFAAEALPLAKPAQTGEEWKRAYKTYVRYAPQIIDAGRRNDLDAACDLFSRAAQEVSEIYSDINPGDPMAEQLSIAVYEALSRLYNAGEADAQNS
ncbi:MAG: hypothetical protein ACI4V3_06845 [Faecousia sp.]